MANLTRRGFISACGLTAAAVAFKPASYLFPDKTADVALDGALRVGDIFTIAGRYAVNPITGLSTGVPQAFMVTAVASSGAEVHPYLETSVFAESH